MVRRGRSYRRDDSYLSRMDPFTEADWEALETVKTIASLTDRTPAELLEAAYHGSFDKGIDLGVETYGD